MTNNHENRHHCRAERSGEGDLTREFLPNKAVCPVFVNADLIAAGLSPFSPERTAMQEGRG